MRISRLLVIALLVSSVFAVRFAAQAPDQRFVPGQILVRFVPGTAASLQAQAHGLAGGVPIRDIPRIGVQLVAVPAGDEQGAIARYRRNPNVLYAEPNFIRRIPEPISHGSAQAVPADYHFDQQWALHNTGQPFYCIPWIGGDLCFYVGTPDADIDAPEAWAMSTGATETVTVAVIDTGIDYTHPDLIANYAGGYNFLADTPDPMDDHGHGTHVAGTIAAEIGNLTGTPPTPEGVAGVAPHARILAYKVCGADGSCSDAAIAQAIGAAVAASANVINMSLGDTAYSQTLDDAVQDAWNAGLVIVAGAGNNGNTALFYPAALDNVISVAAFDEDHRRASFSSYGSWVDLSGPGNVISSTYPMSACGGASTVPGDVGCYHFLSGTSMATPHVSGAAALVLARSDVTTNAQVVDILLRSADPQGVGQVRLDSWTIHGGLNLHNALSYGVANQAPVAHAGPDQTLTDTNGDGGEMAALDGSASSDDRSIASFEWFEGATPIGLGATPSVWLTVGVHTLTLRVTDDAGLTAVDSVVVTVNPAPAAPLSVTGLSPSVVSQNAGTVTFTISGTGFASGASVAFENGAGKTPRVLSVTRNSSTQLTAVVRIQSGGPRRNRVWDVRVTNPDGATAVGAGLLVITP